MPLKVSFRFKRLSDLSEAMLVGGYLAIIAALTFGPLYCFIMILISIGLTNALGLLICMATFAYGCRMLHTGPGRA
jgi:hypothetical protein